MLGESVDPLNSSLETDALTCLSSLESHPSASKVRLRQLLRQVEKEFESVLIENLALRKELERCGALPPPPANNTSTSKLRASNILPMIRNRVGQRTGGHPSDDHLYSSNNEHKDVIWDLQAGGVDQRYLASASADQSSIIWSKKTGRSLVQYLGHRGSVNSCRFSAGERDLMLTASGDQEIHLWKWTGEETTKDDDDEEGGSDPILQSIRTPLLALRSDDVVACADWLQRDHLVSASWDRSVTLWQIEMGIAVRTLHGHDGELTYVSCHPSKPLFITSSLDGTFRLWDCRTASHSVQIFNGHTKSVNSALFLGGDRLVSSSDDGFVHIWDSRSASCSPLISLECVSPCNRLSICNEILAVPLDNRDIRLYSTHNGEKLHVQRRCHTRAVQCTVLLPSAQPMEYLLASGSLDRQIHGWLIKKLKGNNNQPTKALKPLDDETQRNGINQNKRTPLTEKANHLVNAMEKKHPTSGSNTRNATATSK